jgi:hypothetical protein
MGAAEGDLDGLLKEWDDVTQWADMTEVEPACEQADAGASLAMAEAVATAQAAVGCEEGVLRRIEELKQEADLQRELVQAQV